MIGRRLAVVLVAVLVVASCSGDSDDATSTTDRGTSSGSSATTTASTSSSTAAPTSTTTSTASTAATIAPSTPEPPATDTAAVAPVLQALMDRHDGAVAAVLADPRVAHDGASPLVGAYVALFVPDATFPTTVIEGWRREAAQGRFYRSGPAGAMRRSTVMRVTAASEDEASFTVCIRNSIVVTDAGGVVLESQGGVAAGVIDAARIGGIWLLRDLSQAPPDGCPAPGGGT